MRRVLAAALILGLGAVAAPAQVAWDGIRPNLRPVPEAPLRPLLRPVRAVQVAPAPLRPMLRPVAEAAVPVAAAPEVVEVISTRNVPVGLLVPSAELRAERLLRPTALNLHRDAWSRAVPPVRPEAAALLLIQPFAATPLRPRHRPERQLAAVQITPGMELPGEEGDSAGIEADPGFTVLAVALALRPPERPEAIVTRASQIRQERVRGALCGTVGIQGDRLGSVGGPGRCGVSDAVRVRAIAGVRLTTPATIDCTTARALLNWVQNGAIPAIGNTGGGLASLRVVSHYSCRTRNNQPGARLSEHSFGRAIDIAAMGLRDGSEITVLRGWNSAHGERLRRMWRAACGPFGTVLGPNANRYHRDHFHFDTARYRSGSYCR